MIDTPIFPINKNVLRYSANSSEARIIKIKSASTFDLFIGNSVYMAHIYEQGLYEIFIQNRDVWLDETSLASSSFEIFNNASYQNIINLGENALQFIFEDWKHSNNHWFYALESITGVNPITPKHRGSILQMKNDWIRWADNYGVI